MRYYSSTSEEEVEEEEGAAHAHDNEVEEKEASSDTELPVLRETLCLCYIGSLLLRLPLSLGDFYRYVLIAGISSRCLSLGRSFAQDGPSKEISSMFELFVPFPEI